jgi:hypothetical protein
LVDISTTRIDGDAVRECVGGWRECMNKLHIDIADTSDKLIVEGDGNDEDNLEVVILSTKGYPDFLIIDRDQAVQLIRDLNFLGIR